MNDTANNTSSQPDADLWALASRACDGTLTPDEQTRLDAILQSEDARRCFGQYMLMHGELRWRSRGDVVYDEEPALPTAAPVFDVVGTPWRSPVSFFSQGLPFCYLIATLVVGFGLLLSSLVPVSTPVHVVTQTGPVPASHSSRSTFVGRITGMVDCQWADPQTEVYSSGYVPLGRKYDLVSGLMEITYDTGAKVILQGPVTYEVDSASGGFLYLGKLTARVESRGSRVESNQTTAISRAADHSSASPLFAVRTPIATVTDLGTEFGVEVGEGTTETHVFVGKVAMTFTTGDNQQTTEQIICAGNTARVDNKGDLRTMTTLSEGRFVRVVPHPTPTSRSEAYATKVLSMKPVVYYRMERPKEEKDRFTLFDSAPGGYHGTVHSVNEYAQPWLRGRLGDSLCLHGASDSEYAIVPDYPKAQDGELSASAWVFCRGQTKFNTIVGNWGSETCGQFALSLCQDSVNNGRDDGLYAVVAQPDNQLLYVREGGSKPFPIAQWQHVAFVFDKTTLRLYRNGNEVASGKCDGLLTKVEMPRLNIGCDVTDDGSAQWNFWHGQIDELAIFNRALTAKEIQRLYKPEAKESTTIEK